MKVLITFPHSFFNKKVAGLPLLGRMIKVLQRCGIWDIYIMSNILELNEGSIKIIRKKEEIPSILGDHYLLIDNPVVFDEQYIKSVLAENKEGVITLSKLQKEYPGIFVPISKKADVKKSQKLLLKSLRKPHDTLISRTLNRPVSLAVSKLLMNTKLTPHIITLFVFLIGVSASVILIVMPNYWGGVIGGTIFHLASVLDGCDGEIARLRFQTTRMGMWLDGFSDELTNFFFIGALGIFAATYYQNTIYLTMGLITVILYFITKLIQYGMIFKGLHDQDISKFEFEFEKTEQKGLKKVLGFVFDILKNVARNDFLAFGMMITGFFGILNVGVIVSFFMTIGLFVSVTIDFIKKVIFKRT